MRIRCDAGVYSEPFRMTVLPANNGIAIALNARILYSHYQLLDERERRGTYMGAFQGAIPTTTPTARRCTRN